MALGAYVCGWYVKSDPDLGRVVTNDVFEDIQTNARPYVSINPVWPDARPDNGEPDKGAVLVIVDAPDDTHKALEKLPNKEVVPMNLNAAAKSGIEGFLQTRGIPVDIASAETRRDAAGRVARALNGSFQDFTGAASEL